MLAGQEVPPRHRSHSDDAKALLLLDVWKPRRYLGEKTLQEIRLDSKSPW